MFKPKIKVLSLVKFMFLVKLFSNCLCYMCHVLFCIFPCYMDGKEASQLVETCHKFYCKVVIAGGVHL